MARIQQSSLSTTSTRRRTTTGCKLPIRLTLIDAVAHEFPIYSSRLQYVCHLKKDIHYSPKKMWYVACFVRGMTVDEALRQLSFCHKKGASFVRDTILEAQQLAVKHHNVEFKTNLWVGQYLISNI